MKKKTDSAAKGEKLKGRQAALAVLMRVYDDLAYADEVLANTLEETHEIDRALTTELVYGVLRHQLKTDWIIGQYSKVPITRMETLVLNALRLGIYQLYFMDNIPESAAVNESVELAKTRGKAAAGFVNAVLRKANAEKKNIKYPDVLADAVKHISIVYSHPEWLVKRWIARFGIEATIELCDANNRRPGRVLRVNTLVNSREGLMEILRKEGSVVEKTEFSNDGIAVIEGQRIDPSDRRFYIQDEASQLVAQLVAPHDGEWILDACAAPGGKATHLAQLMNNCGRIDAVELHTGRVKRIIETSARLGAVIVTARKGDAAADLEFAPKNGYDAILCDAPCSGLGVLRRTPDIKIRITEKDILALSARQSALLENLAKYVKKGGRLVYSVCTIEPEETDRVISGFIKTHPDFAIESAKDFLGSECGALTDAGGFLRTFPHKHNMDGFFGVRMRRR